MKKVKATITGMHCASCASNIERSLKKIKGVTKVTISVLTKKGFIEIDDTVTNDELKKAIARAGYTLAAIEEEKNG